MSSRKAVAIRRREFVCGVLDPALSRARELVESGLLDRAAQIAALAHSLTDSAIRAMEAECSGRVGAVADIRSLRSAAFGGIAQNIIERIEGRGR
jgi:hypothetical protein